MVRVIRKWAVCSAVWFVLIVIGTIVYLWNASSNEFSSRNDVSRSSDYTYITDNGVKEGLVYQMDGERITGFFHTGDLVYLQGYYAIQVALMGENPCVVFAKDKDDSGRGITEYAIVSFNTDMQPTAITPPFRLELPMELSGFSATEENLFITGIAENRRMVYVYSVPTAQMLTIETTALSSEDVEKWEKQSTSVKEVTSEGSEGVRFYANAQYAEGTLSVRLDNELAGDFAVDADAAKIYKGKHLSVSRYLLVTGVSLSFLLLLLFFGIAVLFVFCLILYHRKRVVYHIAFSELVLCAGLLILYGFYAFGNRQISDAGYTQWASTSALSVFDGYGLADLSDTTIYSGDDYRVITDRMQRMKTVDYNGQYATCGVEATTADSTVLLSSDGCNFENLSEKYGKQAASLLSGAISSGSVQSERGSFDGKQAIYVAVPLSKAGFSGYGAIVVAQIDDSEFYHSTNHRGMCILLLLIFLVASVVIITLQAEQHRDITELQRAVGELSRGYTDIQKPKVLGKDLNYIWNSLYEIQKNIRNINREKLLTYEAYFRFAPKGVERILDLDSITDVKGKEHVKRQGTIATLSVAGSLSMEERSIDLLSGLYTELEACREQYHGIFISHTNSFDLSKYLFLEGEKHSVEFGRDFIQKIHQEKEQLHQTSSILLWYTDFIYGVVGDKEQASIYMTSPHSKLMEELALWLRLKRIPLVMTQSVLDYEKPDASLRYIGFVLPKDGSEEQVRLYEVLDALPVNLRQKREETLVNFDEALQLFYERDFYLARNIFSEILRKAPEDEMSKWYLFACEKYLDEAVPEDFSGAILME